MEDEKTKVKLTTQEGEEVEVERKIIEWSVLVKGVVDDAGLDDAVPLPSVTKPVLEKVVKFLEYITVEEGQPKKKPKIKCPLVDADLKNSIEDHWFVDYVDIDKKALYDLILAANFMDIKCLLKLTTAKVATYLKGKSLEEMRAEFGVTDHGWTPEEYKQIEQELKWAEEAF